ncbi:MAG: PQQ-binding-like beta-propeller repeat protein, partial [Desulfobulbaceae bacterium]|nr:PQQ-binding-like beta-propeller repeat protein [Desulfobulbaceae bacterium]
DAQTGATPAVMNGNVLFGTELGTFYSIAAKTLEVDWQHSDAKRKPPIRAAAAVERRGIIYPNHGKQVTALDPTDGTPLWTFDVRSRVESSPVIAGDLVFLPTKRGRLYAVDVVSGKEKWQYQAGGSFLASPAVAQGKLVIGNEDGTLYCFGEKKKKAADGR